MDLVFTVNGIVAGLILLWYSFATGRAVTFLIGLISLTHLLVILDRIIGSGGVGWEDWGEGFSTLYESITQSDLEVNQGSGRGRIYVRPRLPMIRNGVRVSVKGNPGSKIMYWPVGGNGIGGRNDELDLQGVGLQDIRTRALGVGVTVLDEEGKGIAVTEDGIGELLFREVYGDHGGPVHRITVG